MSMRALLGLIAAIAACDSLSAASPEARLDWSVDSGVRYTDNATLVSDDTVDDVIGSIGGTMDIVRQGTRLDATLTGAGAFISYLDDTYDNDFLGYAAVTGRFQIIPDALAWALENTFGQSTSNQFEPSTPENRSNVNVLSTGPDISLNLGRATEVAFTGRYEQSTYEGTSADDSQSWIGEVGLGRRLSDAAIASLRASTSHVDYDDPGAIDYDQNEIFLRWDSKSSKQTLIADAGAVFLDDEGEGSDKPVVRVDWSRRLTPSWSLGLGVGSGYRNAGEQFAAGITDDINGGGTQDIIVTNQVQRYKSARVQLGFARPRTTFVLFTTVDEERYPDSAALDRDAWIAGMETSRRITDRLRALLEVSYEERTFKGTSADDNTTFLSLGADWRLGRTLFLELEAGTERRSGDTTFDYDETYYQASLSFRPSGRQ
jgi:Putative beta-barrel porin 2